MALAEALRMARTGVKGIIRLPAVFGYVAGGGYSITAGMMQEIYPRTKYHTGPRNETIETIFS